MEKLAVLIVDQSVVNRKEMTDIVNSTDYGMALRNASNGQIALEWLQQFIFDVILLDVKIVADMGNGYIQTIKATYPRIKIIILSDSTSESAMITLDAMNNGAMDFILRSENNSAIPTHKIKQALESIFTQIKVQQYLIPSRNITSTTNAVQQIVEPVVKKRFVSEIDLVLIASSTGGPAALETVFQNLPADFTKPMLIVQHMPPEFTHVLADSLNKKYKKNIYEAKQNDIVKPETFLVAPGGYHMIVEESFGKTMQVRLLDTPFYNGLKPAADILFKSVSEVCRGKNILIVVLTGMGNDGTLGIKQLKETCNCYCITQSEKSCVVYGMPKCVDEAGLSDEVVELKDIAYRMHQLTQKKG